MSKTKVYREYRLKSYLNMNHFIIIDGKPGQVHPHTWEFVSVIIMRGDDFVEFRTFEQAVDQFLEIYQNRILNEVEPFDVTVPTVENVTDYFAEELTKIIADYGGELVSLEGSETPTRGYIVSRRNEPKYVEAIEKITEDSINSMVTNVVSQIKQNM